MSGHSVNIPHCSASLLKYFKLNIRRSRQLCAASSSDPSVANIHQLRVALRRTRTVLTLLKDQGIKTLSTVDSQNLSKLRKTLAKRRDADVAREILSSIGEDVPHRSEIEALHTNKLLKRLQKKKNRQLFRNLAKLAKDLKGQAISPEKTIRKQLEKLSHVYQKPSEVHAFRIVLKNSRYVLEGLGLSVDEFKPYQNVMGELNDLETLFFLTDEDPGIKKRRDKKLKEALKVIAPARKLAVKKLTAALTFRPDNLDPVL
ncbi:MAG TPA: CHAD domain-containing protein [Bacteriovoracaceae bacterium]|nr:CHAD domain-containing protein [Bacteriovoracaceae bacterium]